MVEMFERFGRHLLDEGQDLVVLLSPDLRYTWVNNKYLEYYGCTREEVVGKHARDQMGEERLRQTLEGAIGRCLEGESAAVQEWVEYPAAGRRFMFMTCAPARDEHGDVIQVLAFARDITDLKLSEERLAASVADEQALAELGKLALQLPDLHSYLQRVSDRIAQLFDIELVKVLEKMPGEEALLLVAGVGWREGLVGKATVPSGDRSQAGYTLLTEAPVIQTDWSREERFTEPRLLTEHGVCSGISVLIGGLEAPYGILAIHSRRPRVFRDDQVLFLVNTANLIAEVVARHRATQALHETRERYRHLLESSPSVIYAKSLPDFRWEFITANSLQVSGHDPARIVGDSEYWNERLHPDDRVRVKDEMATALRNGEGLLRYRFRHAAGYYLWIEDRFRVIRDGARQPVEVVGALTDISEEVARDETLRSSEAMLGYVIDTITDAVIVVDDQFRVVVFNAAAETLFGIARDKMAGRDVHELMPERYREIHRRHMQEFRERPTAGRMGPDREIYGLRGDGREFLINACISRAKLPRRTLYTVVLRTNV